MQFSKIEKKTEYFRNILCTQTSQTDLGFI